MLAIVNTDRDWGIGRDDELLVRISADLKRFKTLTMGKVMIYGRKTLQTFPKGKVLPGRKNIIFSRDEHFSAEGAVIVHNVYELSEVLKELVKEGYTQDDFVVIGGESIYHLLLSYTDVVEVTQVDAVFEADRYFPNLDDDPEWLRAREGEWREDDKSGYRYRYLRYERKSCYTNV